MIKKEEVFLLVKSLSRTEKRYFTMFSGRTVKGSNYVRLFEAMDAQNKYDESAIKARFAGEAFVRQFHVTKNYLRQMILKSLRNYHDEISREAELKDVLRNVELLFNKELYHHAETELKRAEHLVAKYELISGRIETLNWKQKLKQTRSPHDYEAFREILFAQKEAIETMGNSNRYARLIVDVSESIATRNGEASPDEVLLEDPANALSFEAMVMHYNAAYFRNVERGRPEQAENMLKELIAIMESREVQIMESPGMYVSSINNLISFYVFRKEYDKAITLVQQARKVYDRWKKIGDNRTLLKQILRTYNVELEIYRDLPEAKQEQGQLEELEQFISGNANKMPKEYYISFSFQFANIHFTRSRYHDALKWVNIIINSKDKSVRPDIQLHARWLNLMVHTEQRNLFVLRYFVDSTRRYIRKYRRERSYELHLLKFFSGISKAPVMEYRERFAELQETLFPQNAPSIIPTDELDYVDLKTWLKARS